MRNIMTFKSRLKLYHIIISMTFIILIGLSSFSIVMKDRLTQKQEDYGTQFQIQAQVVEAYLSSIESGLMTISTTMDYFEQAAPNSSGHYFDKVKGNAINGLYPYLDITNALDMVTVKNGSGKFDLLDLREYEIRPGLQTIWTADPNDEKSLYILVVNELTDTGKYLVTSVHIESNHLTALFESYGMRSVDVLYLFSDAQMLSMDDSDRSFITLLRNLVKHGNYNLVDNEKGTLMVTPIMDGKLHAGFAYKALGEDSLITATRVKYGVIMMILAVLSAVMSLIYSEHMYKPIYNINAYTQKMIDGTLSTKIPIWHSGIFKHIAKGINSVAFASENNCNVLLEQSMEMMKKQDELVEVNQSLEFNNEALTAVNRKLEYSKEKFRALIENMHDLVWMVDEKYNIVFLNKAFEERLGVVTEEYIGKPFDILLAGSDKDAVRNRFFERMSDSNLSSVHSWFKKNSVEDVEFMLTNTVRVFSGGELRGIQGISRPVSETWMLTQKLSRRNQALEDIRDITRVLAQENNLNALFDLIIKKIYELYEVSLCGIRVLNEAEELELVRVTGTNSSEMIQKLKRNEKDIRFKALDEGRMYYMDDVLESYFENYEEMEYARDHTKAFAVLPLVNGSEYTGVITILFKEKLPQNELMILSTIAIQSMLAIKKAKLFAQQREEFLATIRVLVTAIEAKDAYTEGHSNRVSEFATLIGREMGLVPDALEDIQIAGMLHDIGKIGVNDLILKKSGKLNSFEVGKIKEHPEIGQRILQPIGFSKSVMDGVMLHHKRHDLTGYPESISIAALPLSAAIIGVSDALDAMTSKRSYSEGRPLDEAMDEIIRNSGTQFDPEVVKATLRIFESRAHVLEQIIQGKVQVMS